MKVSTTERMLVGPRLLDGRICRLLYADASDEVWTEEWKQPERRWERSWALVRHLLAAPAAPDSMLRRFGVPAERGEWDSEQACA